MIRSVEHLSNTPRQIFIFQALRPAAAGFSHLPYVAETGSQNKLSKRKIAKLPQAPRLQVAVRSRRVAIVRRIGRSVEAESFNPVLVDFYRARLDSFPRPLLNYLLLLGLVVATIGLSTFTRDEMIRPISRWTA